MKNKIMKLKYPKNPGTLLDKPEVQTYIWYLEDSLQLDKLPLSFLVYYVVGCRLTDEVNNGGFSQYLSNSSIQTLPYLERCINAINNKELIGIYNELISALSKEFDINDIESIAKADYSEDLEKVLTSLEGKFYELDDQIDVLKLAKQYYKDNIPVEKLIFEMIKPSENERLRYFVYDKTGISNEEATEAFISFLGEFSNIDFEILIERWGGMFRIDAVDYTNSINLDEIHNHFDDISYSFGKKKGTNRLKMLGFKFDGGIFKEIHVDACDEENWVWRLTINESGFDENEYEISYQRFYSGSKKKISRICVGDFGDDVVESIKQILVNGAKNQDNIKRIYEEIIDSKIINEIYLK